MSRVLVTGGAGFIGSHVCEALLRRGDDVIALDNFDDFYDPQFKRRNLREAMTHRRFRLIDGDIRDAALIHALFQDMDAVIHLAARAGVRPSIEQPLLYEDVNVRGTLVLLESLKDHSHCRFVFGSSSSVYGNNKKVPFAESDRVDAPISPYACTKLAGELLCRTYHHLYRIPITCLRFFTVYGPRQRPDLAIHKFARLVEAHQPVPMFGDGASSRDYTYIDDIVRGVLAALDRVEGFHIYNLGGSHPVTLRQLISLIEKAVGREALIEQRASQPGDVERTFADVRLAEAGLGFVAQVRMEEGLRRFVEWFRSENGKRPSRPLEVAGIA